MRYMAFHVAHVLPVIYLPRALLLVTAPSCPGEHRLPGAGRQSTACTSILHLPSQLTEAPRIDLKLRSGQRRAETRNRKLTM
jgi:hypothetical protein